MTTVNQQDNQMLTDPLMPSDFANVQIICIIGKSCLQLATGTKWWPPACLLIVII